MEIRASKLAIVVSLMLGMVVVAGAPATLDAQETHGEPDQEHEEQRTGHDDVASSSSQHA